MVAGSEGDGSVMGQVLLLEQNLECIRYPDFLQPKCRERVSN